MSAPEEDRARRGDQKPAEHSDRKTRRKHRGVRGRSSTGVSDGRPAHDPFRPAGRELFDLGSAAAAPGNGGQGAQAGAAAARALPAMPGGDPRRERAPHLHQRRTTSSSSSSSSSDSSSTLSSTLSSVGGALHSSTIRRDQHGNLIVVDSRAARGHRRRGGREHRDGTDSDDDKSSDHSATARKTRRTRKGRLTKQSGRAADTVVVVAAEQEGEADGGTYDYDPDHPEALNEKARLLKATVETQDPATNGGLQLPPGPFQAAPIPYWVQRVSELLLFHNGVGSRSGPRVLPVDAALSQLRADLKEARRLREEVRRGADWGFLRTRPACSYEVYGPTEETAKDDDPVEREMTAPVLAGGDGGDGGSGSQAENPTVEVHVLETEEVKAGKAASGDASSGLAPPLLPPKEEAEDEARPLLQRQIPLWRRRGAADKTLAELIDYLENRLRLLEKKLSDRVNGPWYEAVGAPNSTGVEGSQRATLPPAIEHAYASLMTNAVLSDLFAPVHPFGNGLRERAARISAAFLAQTPKVHAQFVVEEDFRPMYDSLVARPANLFESPYASMISGSSSRDVKERHSFTVHVDYIRLNPPQSSDLLMMSQATRMPASTRSGPHARRLSTRGEDRFSQLLADTQYYSSLLTGDTLEDTLMIAESVPAVFRHGGGGFAATVTPGHSGSRPAASAASASSGVDALTLSPTSVAALSMLSVATAQRNALVAFTPEAYLTAMLLQHYERYRLLRLNLLPHLKARHFYEEQLVHLSQQHVRTTAMEQLQGQIEMLRDKATELERTAMTAMIALWSAILHLRSRDAPAGSPSEDSKGPEIPFMVSSHHAARAATLSAAAPSVSAVDSAQRNDTSVGRGAVATPDTATSEMLRMTAEIVGEPSPQRRNVQEMEIFSSDSASSSLPLDGSATNAGSAGPGIGLDPTLNPTAFAGRALDGERRGGAPPGASSSVLLGSTTTPSSLPAEAVKDSQGYPSYVDGGGDGVVVVRSARRAPRFRFFLRRVGHTAETPYVKGDNVLLYEPVVEGADALPPLSPAGAAQGHSRSAAKDQLSDEGLPREHLDGLQFFQIAVFARASAAVPPQYVGCTVPRPLTAAKVIFFNESFEIRVLREPIEIILHVLAVSDGVGKGRVVATVRLQPMLTRGYLLLPLQPPVSFMFKKRLMARYPGAGLTGVLSASTTWTTAQGLSIAQTERLFLSGAADPLNPEYAPVMRLLKKYYTEVQRNEAKQQYHRGNGGSGGGGSGDGNSADTYGGGGGGGGGSRRVSWGQRRRRGGPFAGDEDGDAPSPGFGSRSRSSGVAVTQESGGRGVDRGRRSLSMASGLRGRHFSSVVRRLSRASDAAWSRGGREAAPQRKKTFAPEMLADLPLVVGTTHGAGGQSMGSGAPPLSTVWTDRLLLMRHRWLIATGQSKALDHVEARLLRHPIPLLEDEQYDLLKAVKRELAKEAVERRRAYSVAASGGNEENSSNSLNNANGSDALFDERAYVEEPSSISGLALSPLPKEVKLKLWQDRQRHMKLTRKPVRHITDEEKLGQIVTIPKFSLQLVLDLKPRSQFNPRRVARPKNEDIDRELLNRRRDSRIVVHIMKANNLPSRADGTPLEPFVQVGFVYENAYSRCEIGTSPTWFQSLEMPFQPLDFEEETLSMIDDDIILSVYDKVEIPIPPSTVTTGAVAHVTHYRTERRLLGTLHLPFYSLHQAAEARMEGVFPLSTPRWLLGYDTTSAAQNEAAQNPFGEDPTQFAAGNRSVSSGPTIQLYVSLWPPLQRERPKPLSGTELATMVRQLNVNVELHYLHEAALKWAKSAAQKISGITRMNAQATTRKVEPFVNCSTGDLMLSCRYLLPRGGPPPPLTVSNIFEAIRYVSLLPFVVDIMTWGDKDVWSTNVELLTMRSGDYEELALLLAHFLRFLDPDNPTYVVVGEGEIYAQTILVLHAFEGGSQWRLIDPRTGWISPVERPFGTVLRDVHYVLSHNQMWANIQLSGLPHRMSWDLNDSVHWLPCFDLKDKRIARCMPSLTSIQREALFFQPADGLKSKEIEVDLRAALKKSLLAWRNHRPPAFHRGVEAILRDLLVIAEEEKCACGSVRHPAITAAARERLAEYFGLPVDGALLDAPRATKRKRRRSAKHRKREGSCEPATDSAAGKDSSAEARGTEHRKSRSARQRPCIHLVGAPVTSSYSPSDKHYSQILQLVYECAAHEVGTDEVSFAAGVYVKSYTGDVFAMWVFLVAICRGVEDVPNSEED